MSFIRASFQHSGDPVGMHKGWRDAGRRNASPGKRGIRQCVRKLAVALALALPVAFGWAVQAAAQERVLVSNIGQPGGTVGFGSTFSPFDFVGQIDNGQKFRTGSNAPGYRVSSVEIEFAAFDPGYGYSVSIRRNASGAPGAVVGTLQNPTFNSFTADKVLTFTAPTSSGLLIDGNTDYFVVIDITSVVADFVGGWRITTSNNEDSSGLSGWRIDNKHRFRRNNGSWQDNVLTSILKLRLNGWAVQPAGLAITEDGTPEKTEVSEDGTTVTDVYTVALNSVPEHDVTVTATAGAGVKVDTNARVYGDQNTLTFTAMNWNTAQTVAVRGVPDSIDNPGGSRDVTISHAASSADTGYSIASAGSITAQVTDDDPTTVTLSAAAGNLEEGRVKAFTIVLGRGLVNGESLTVPLTFGGTATRGTDYTMAGTSATGVRYNNLNSGNASVVFTGPESGATATAATINLSAVSDSTAESTPETVDIAFGTITNTGLTGAGGVSETDSLAEFNIADPLPPGVTFSASPLRLLENGSATYTVVLDREPTADVTLTITGMGAHPAAATANPTTLTFTPGGAGIWSTPRTVTVTGADEPGGRRNRTLTLRHAAASTDGGYSGDYDLPVEVDDAPEVEAWEGWERADGDRGDNATLFRSNTVASTPGLWPRQDFIPGAPLDYVIRLSNRPAPGETVTVHVDRSNNSVQLGLTRTGPWSNSLTVTFGDGFAEGAAAPNMDACNNSHDWTEGGEAHDGTAATSWECWRKVWVRPRFSSGGPACADLTHTASGGGIRGRSIETIRAHNWHYYRRGDRCTILTPDAEPGNAPATDPGIPVPDSQVSNVQVTAVDAANARVTWDAVEHATSYQVAYETTSTLVDELNRVQGAAVGWTDTELTFRHDAAEAMTLTVTVTPAYEDENGNIRHLDSLASSATVEVGPTGISGGNGDSTKDGKGGNTGPVNPQAGNAAAASCVSDDRWKIVKHYYEINSGRAPNYGANWYRVLIAYRQARPEKALPGWEGGTAKPTTHYTVKEAEKSEKIWSGWTPVRKVLECLEKANGGSSTDAVTGGVPSMGQSGETGFTSPESTRERDRWNPQNALEGFEPEVMPDFAAGTCVSPQLRSAAAARAGETWRGPAHVERWLRVVQTFSGGANDATVVTPAEANFQAVMDQPGWLPVADALRCLERQALSDELSR